IGFKLILEKVPISLLSFYNEFGLKIPYRVALFECVKLRQRAFRIRELIKKGVIKELSEEEEFIVACAETPLPLYPLALLEADKSFLAEHKDIVSKKLEAKPLERVEELKNFLSKLEEIEAEQRAKAS
ncbi:MAG: hypothetical protein D6780_00030, partial [Candidatus Dadabacteria bacterium]